MSKKVYNYIQSFFQGHERTVKAKKNIIASLFIKGLSVLANLLLVPLTINYLNPTKYGIWLTLYSIVGWFTLFDIGLGNGLRNKFAEALAKREKEKARNYVSTTYAILTIIVVCFFIVFVIINTLLNWSILLNAPKSLNNELSTLVLIVFGFFSIKFVLQLISTILIADQRPAYSNLFNLINNFVALIIIYILTKTTESSLKYLGTVISGIPIFVYFVASFHFYRSDYKEYIPKLKFVDFKYAKDLMQLSLNFFIIQISAIILFTTDNLIITQILGPASVTTYNIALKYFSLIIIFFGIIMSPFWSAFTEAYIKNEIKWIKLKVKQLITIWVGFDLVVILMVIISTKVYSIWIGDEIKVPFILSLLMGIYVVISMWNNIFAFFLNGIGKIKLSLYQSIIIGILNIPLSIVFAKQLDLGINGIILATIVCLLISTLLQPIQYYKIINSKAYGIWSE